MLMGPTPVSRRRQRDISEVARLISADIKRKTIHRNKSVVWSIRFPSSSPHRYGDTPDRLSARACPRRRHCRATNTGSASSNLYFGERRPLGVYTTTFWPDMTAPTAPSSRSPSSTAENPSKSPSKLRRHGNDTGHCLANYVLNTAGAATPANSVSTGSYLSAGNTEELSETLELERSGCVRLFDEMVELHLSPRRNIPRMVTHVPVRNPRRALALDGGEIRRRGHDRDGQ